MAHFKKLQSGTSKSTKVVRTTTRSFNSKKFTMQCVDEIEDNVDQDQYW